LNAEEDGAIIKRPMSWLELNEADQNDGVRIIRVAGELDLAVIEGLRQAIDRAAEEDQVLVDLGPCEFIDSSAIALLIERHRSFEQEGRRFAVFGATRQVRRVLEMTGMTENGLVFLTAEEASDRET
jgi:anti-anti-sigma factor